MVLHADEFGPAVALGAELEHGELVGAHAGGADVADFAALHEVAGRDSCVNRGVCKRQDEQELCQEQ